MSNVPNTECVTVKRNEKGEVDIYVGGKPARTYHGQNIWDIPYIKEVFAWMQAQNPDVEEFHIGAFETPGEFARSGNPSSVFGPHAWCRLKFKNGKYGSWIFVYTSGSAADCVRRGAFHVRNRTGFRAAVFRAPIEKTVEDPTVGINGRGLAQLIVNSVYVKQK